MATSRTLVRSKNDSGTGSPHPVTPATTLAPLSPGTRGFVLYQTTLLPTGRGQTISMLLHRTRPTPANPHIWSRSPHAQLLCPQKHEQLLVQSGRINYQHFLLHDNIHSLLQSLPPSHCPILQVHKTPRSTRYYLCPTNSEPSCHLTPIIVLFPLSLEGSRDLKTPHERHLLHLTSIRMVHCRPNTSNQKAPLSR